MSNPQDERVVEDREVAEEHGIEKQADPVTEEHVDPTPGTVGEPGPADET